MSSRSPQYLVETDVLAEYLVTRPMEVSLLRLALRNSVCYTTMLNALELFRAAGDSAADQASVLQLLHLVRVLGFNARYAEPFAQLARTLSRSSDKRILTNRETMILGMARASKLTVLTKKYYERYVGLGSEGLQTAPFEVVAVVNVIDGPGPAVAHQ